MSDISKTLQKIKDNPGCNSHDFDCKLVKMLFDRGLIEGFNITSSLSIDKNGNSLEHEYQDLNITFDGEEYLARTSKTESESYWRIEKLWVPILVAILVLVLSIYLGNK